MKHQLNLGVRTWLHLNRVRFKVEKHLAKHLDCYDLTPAQFGVLAHLQAYPDISQQRLANLLFVTKGNIVGLLNRLEQRDLVQRRPDPEDGRTHVVSLTERGRALAAQVVPEQEKLVVKYMAFATLENQRELHQLLLTLDRNLGSD
ncbi:MarR family transcriptional regulator [Dictyobacter alpinus]|uniref:MarR family transcriptional regulator n=1 Tax=Dictyobacter alpinus TaxID=2014873 RepID=A0A402BF23_9CHLR|nr:MarR family transcriptional regulator [Dictyobacter alpinus]GCE29890.1 MarR family transcriptional regulator [Dictyobacter alpinus]